MWWFKEAPDWTLFLVAPALAFGLAIWLRADWRSRDMLVMMVVASIGYLVNYWMTKATPNQTDLVAAVAAFTVGFFGNTYSRVWGGSAFPSMVVGIMLLVPNSIAAAGGLSVSSSDASDDSTQQINSAVLVSIRLVQSGIGLAGE